MADLNSVSIVGRVTADPTIRHTASGVPVTTLRVANNGRRRDEAGNWADDPNFFDVVVWNKPAENAVEYCKKGRQIAVNGRLAWRTWTAQDGSNRSTVEIVANDIQYLAQPNGNAAGQAPAPADPPPSDDLPF